MSEEQNPYKAPDAELVSAGAQEEAGTPEPRGVDVGRGVGWFGDGWRLFKAAPGIWIANVVILLVITLVLAFIPIVSLLNTLLSPVFMGGLMLGCRDLDRGEPLTVNHLFAGFSQRTGALIGLGAIYLVLIFVVMAITMGLMFGMGGGMQAAMSGNPGSVDPTAVMAASMTGMLVGLALIVPVIMLYWFAPALIVLHPEVGVIEAMKLSFSGCLKNILPFLVYGIVGIVIAFVASIPFGLGWLVAGPVFIGSIYAGYKDIFIGE